MKELRGTAVAAVGAPAQECMALLEAVDKYPTWYPEVVREVEVLERHPEGAPSRVRTTLHVAQGPLTKDFELVMAVGVQPTTVSLTRIPSDASDKEVFEVIWHVEAPGDTRIRVELHATLSAPRFLPIGGLGDAVARGFVAAAARALVADRA
jgi:hypothetical protein